MRYKTGGQSISSHDMFLGVVHNTLIFDGAIFRGEVYVRTL